MMPRGYKQSVETKAKISAASRATWQQPGHRERVLQARRGYKHSPATKAKIAAAHHLRVVGDPIYLADRRRYALEATQAARQKFLASLATTALVIGEIPLTKGDAKALRTRPCALCRTTATRRELAHIAARSNGGPARHVWGNVVPLCRRCHERIDHGRIPVDALAAALDVDLT